MLDDTMPQENTKKTFEIIENMTIIKKNLQEIHNAEEKNDSKAQSIELEFTFDIPRVS
jgi:hypothetical protein